jgi:hypothetical protein
MRLVRDEPNCLPFDPTGDRVLPIVRQLREAGATLQGCLLYAPDRLFGTAGEERVAMVGRYADLGLSRLIAFPSRWSVDLESQASFAADAIAAGLELAVEEPATA